MKTANLTVLILGIIFLNNVYASGDPAKGKIKTAECVACHGPNGDSAAPTFPKLAGQHASYLQKQLQDFIDGKRSDPSMDATIGRLVKENKLGKQDILDIAAFYESQKAGVGIAQSEHVVLGRKIYEGGNPRTKVPACIGCHSPTGSGNGPAKYPLLAGQHASYIEKQLKAFRAAAQTVLAYKAKGKDAPKELPGRTNDVNSVMQKVVQDMTDAEIQAVSSYIQGLRKNIPAVSVK